MPNETDDVWVQLATRVPKRIHRALKVYCVTADVSLMSFVTAALREKIERDSGAKTERRRANART